MVDYFTKAAEFAPIPDKSADTVARADHDYWFMRYGMPEWMTTDNGTEFAGAFWHQLERFGIDHVQTSTYHLQSNGAVERLVRTMKDMLTAKIAGATHDWAALLPQLRMEVDNVDMVQWSGDVIKADPFFGRSRVRFRVPPWVSNTIARDHLA